MHAKMRVVVATVTGHFHSDEVGLFVGFVLGMELHFGHDQTGVVAMKLINLESMLPALDEPARLVDDTRFAKVEQVLCLVKGYFLLKLITAQAPIRAWTFNSQVPAVVAESHPDGASATTADVTLLDVAFAIGLTLIVVATDKKLAFDFETAHVRITDYAVATA